MNININLPRNTFLSHLNSLNNNRRSILNKNRNFKLRSFRNGNGNGNGGQIPKIKKNGGNGDHWKKIKLGIIGIGCHVIMNNNIACAASNDDKNETEEMANKIASTVVPFLVQLGFSGLIGFCCACTLKIAGKAVAIGVGLAYLLIQGLAYSGIVEVNWKVFEEKVGKRLDITGDDKFDEKDIEAGIDWFVKFVTHGVPSVGGFCSGFILGMRML